MELPAKYDQACALLAELKSTDDLKDVRDKAIAMQAYAHRAGNKELAAHAAEYRARSERRLGQLMEAKPKAKASGSNQHQVKERNDDNPIPLAQLGISKNLAHCARAAWAMSEAEFEKHINKIRSVAAALADGLKDAVAAARAEVMADKLAKRKQKHQKIAAEAKFSYQKARDLAEGQFGLIYADPPWTFETYSAKGTDRNPDNHYPTMTDDLIVHIEVAGLRVRDLAAPDSVCFMWCTSANLIRAINVLHQWGFTYKTQLVWDKLVAGTGYIFRNQHEILLYGSKGNPPQPMLAPNSVFTERKTTHSTKPAGVRQLLEQMFPHYDTQSRIELFARESVLGWTSWGNEITEAA